MNKSNEWQKLIQTEGKEKQSKAKRWRIAMNK